MTKGKEKDTKSKQTKITSHRAVYTLHHRVGCRQPS